jgi:molecular chaperone GrpE
MTDANKNVDMNSDVTGGGEADTGEAAASQRPAETDATVDELRSRLKDTETQHLRLAADFANFRKRARQEQADTSRHAASGLATRLLPVLDDGERALRHAPTTADENWLRGIELTFRRLRDELASIGLEPIETVGSRFDPRIHEAVGSEESAVHPEGTVVDELRPGYRIGDEVLRPALVRLARRPTGDQAQSNGGQDGPRTDRTG